MLSTQASQEDLDDGTEPHRAVYVHSLELEAAASALPSNRGRVRVLEVATPNEKTF